MDCQGCPGEGGSSFPELAGSGCPPPCPTPHLSSSLTRKALLISLTRPVSTLALLNLSSINSYLRSRKGMLALQKAAPAALRLASTSRMASTKAPSQAVKFGPFEVTKQVIGPFSPPFEHVTSTTRGPSEFLLNRFTRYFSRRRTPSPW